MNHILDRLRETKKLDLFESAHVNLNYPIKDTMRVLSSFVAKGKFDYIGLSECCAASAVRNRRQAALTGEKMVSRILESGTALDGQQRCRAPLMHQLTGYTNYKRCL